ncbi:MAG: MBL fold metallo-hydrolase [Polyangiales bacterium]
MDRVSRFIRTNELRVHYILETHAHADHLSGSQLLKRRFGSKIAIGDRIREVQETFKAVFDLDEAFPTDGSQFDVLLKDGERVKAGTLDIGVIATPGHTPACVTYQVDDAVFTGDALFMEDYGVGRCDFPRGSAEALYASVHEKLYHLPDATRVFVGHDYQPNGRPVRFETTIGASKQANLQLREHTSEEEFITARNARDKTLAAPRLLFQSVQVNIDAGRLPPERSNGRRYFALPVNPFSPTDEAGDRERRPQPPSTPASESPASESPAS